MSSLIIFEFACYCQLLCVGMFKQTYILGVLVIPLNLYSPDKNSAMVLSRLFYCYLFYLNWTCVSFVVLVV